MSSQNGAVPRILAGKYLKYKERMVAPTLLCISFGRGADAHGIPPADGGVLLCADH